MERYFSKSDIEEMDLISRLNLVNSLTGIKPANLVGTKSKTGQENLAIISSVVHLSSNPAIIGFVMRPANHTPMHTYSNITETEYYTINSVGIEFSQKAHYTSAKFDSNQSEFDLCKLDKEYLQNFYAPFVSDSSIKIGMKLLEIVPIKHNSSVLIIGEVLCAHIKDVLENGMLDLENLGIAGISGLNSYYELKKVGEYPYAKPKELPKFK